MKIPGLPLKVVMEAIQQATGNVSEAAHFTHKLQFSTLW